MGTWALPDTKEKALKLAELMKSKITADDAPELLNDILGDDDLFDSFNKYTGNNDIRSQILITLERLLGEPNHTFLKPWPEECRDICRTAFKENWEMLNELFDPPVNEETIMNNYHMFIRDLEGLSRKYGVVIDCADGITMTHPENPYLKRFCYSADYTNGNISASGFFTD